MCNEVLETLRSTGHPGRHSFPYWVRTIKSRFKIVEIDTLWILTVSKNIVSSRDNHFKQLCDICNTERIFVGKCLKHEIKWATTAPVNCPYIVPTTNLLTRATFSNGKSQLRKLRFCFEGSSYNFHS